MGRGPVPSISLPSLRCSSSSTLPIEPYPVLPGVADEPPGQVQVGELNPGLASLALELLGSSVTQSVRIGARARIGAGAVGVPARCIEAPSV